MIYHQRWPALSIPQEGQPRAAKRARGDRTRSVGGNRLVSSFFQVGGQGAQHSTC